jgi:hypothetical protein
MWGNQWLGKRIIVKCDNEASVIVMNSGRSKDPFMQACLRELAFVSARYQVEVRGEHVAGISNRIPDALSRWSLDPKYSEEFGLMVGSEPVHHT